MEGYTSPRILPVRISIGPHALTERDILVHKVTHIFLLTVIVIIIIAGHVFLLLNKVIDKANDC